MFSENQIKAYKSISAPEELKQKVLAMEESRKKPSFKVRNLGVYAVAACLVIVMSLPGIFGGSDLSAKIYGAEIGSEPIAFSTANEGVAILDARTMPGVSVDIELETEKDVEVTVSEGTVLLFDAETGQAQSDTVLRGKALTRWSIDAPEEEKTYEMALKFQGGSSSVIMLEFDRTVQSWTVYYKK